MAATERPVKVAGLFPGLGTGGGTGVGTGGNRKFWRRNKGPRSPIIGNADVEAASPPPKPGPAVPAAEAKRSPAGAAGAAGAGAVGAASAAGPAGAPTAPASPPGAGTGGVGIPSGMVVGGTGAPCTGGFLTAGAGILSTGLTGHRTKQPLLRWRSSPYEGITQLLDRPVSDLLARARSGWRIRRHTSARGVLGPCHATDDKSQSDGPDRTDSYPSVFHHFLTFLQTPILRTANAFPPSSVFFEQRRKLAGWHNSGVIIG